MFPQVFLVNLCIFLYPSLKILECLPKFVSNILKLKKESVHTEIYQEYLPLALCKKVSGCWLSIAYLITFVSSSQTEVDSRSVSIDDESNESDRRGFPRWKLRLCKNDEFDNYCTKKCVSGTRHGSITN